MSDSRVELTISKELSERISTEIEKGVVRFLDNLPQILHEQLTNNAAQILGFRQWGSRWEIETSSSDKKQGKVLTEYINQKVLEKANKVIGTVDLSFTRGMKAGIQKSFEDALADKLRWAISQKAEEVSKELLKQIKLPTINVTVPDTSLAAISNPNFGKTPIENHILKDALEEDQNAEDND